MLPPRRRIRAWLRRCARSVSSKYCQIRLRNPPFVRLVSMTVCAAAPRIFLNNAGWESVREDKYPPAEPGDLSLEVRRRRAHGACEASPSREEEEAMLKRIVDDEQRRDRPQPPCAFRVPAPRGHMQGGATQAMSMHVVEERQPRRCPRAARNAMPPNSRTDP
jgi:hypothetical protein